MYAVAVLLARMLGIALAGLAALLPMRAAQLPVRSYTTADGLPHNTIFCLLPDSRGFMWLCTAAGLARFDGREFRTYGVDEGLPTPIVNTLVETSTGLLVAGTASGLAVLKPRATEHVRSRFEIYVPAATPGAQVVNVLFQDRAGTLWCGTGAGLFRVTWQGEKPHFELVLSGVPVEDVAQSPDGTLWIAAFTAGLVEITPAGETRRYGENQGLPYFVNEQRNYTWVYNVAVDGDGTVWAGTHSGLCRLRRKPLNGDIVERVFNAPDSPSLTGRVVCLYVSRSGRLWVGSSEGGVTELTGDPQRPLRGWRAADGLVDRSVHAIAEDAAGNMWVGTGDEGAKRIARDGMITYTQADGLQRGNITALTEGRNGEFFAVSLLYDSLDLNRFENGRFTRVHPRLPGIHWLGWGWGTIALQDREGDWWVATGEGLCRYGGNDSSAGVLAHSAPKAIYSAKNGLAANEIFKLFEDSRGGVWVATNGPTGLARFERETGVFRRFPESEAKGQYTVFAEHPAGDVWIGSTDGFYRWHAGRLERVDRPGAAPDTAGAFLFDKGGGLWIGNRQGLFRCDRPLDSRPEYRKVLGDPVGCIIDDLWGRLYVCSSRGVIRLDPASGRRRLYTTADGLSRGRFLSGFRDRQGDLWFGLTQGLSRLTPHAEEPQPAAPVFVTAVRANGREVPVAERGETAVGRVSLRPYENSVEVEFVGVEMRTGQSLAYEYRLEGASTSWQRLESGHSVHFASLAPGNYRLLVRAMNGDGAVTDPPASIEVYVMTPLWRRWWSLTLIAIALAASLVGVHRWRTGHLLELERIRTRIATDLHDDVGASLSQVAIMSEVASRSSAAADREALEGIAATSRELLQSMSEIVWAIDPSHDRLHDLTQRMRWFAGETLSGRGVTLQFHAPEHDRDLRIGVDTRRQVFLIFKECVNNIARHSGARYAKIGLSTEENELVLRVEDDGHGFDPAHGAAGHGLRNMAERGRKLGATLELTSRPGAGTAMVLRVPLGPHRARRTAMPA